MRKRLLASLIVCVALLTQIGASLWGATAARNGLAHCHTAIAARGVADAAGDRAAPIPAPATTHDHASCSLCQLGLDFFSVDAPVLTARRDVVPWRVAFLPPETPRVSAFFNFNAPARAPPFHA